jgi:superfamily I DNA/RNA helicase
LALTYSHLFLDEFQDTTQIQYDLVKTIFLGSKTIVTAVGDNKQQIMRWAMAMEEPFVEFERNFGAKRTSLLNNYRSSPELVRIQHILAQALDAEAVEPVSKVEGAISGDSCAVWDFSSPEVGPRPWLASLPMR